MAKLRQSKHGEGGSNLPGPKLHRRLFLRGASQTRKTRNAWAFPPNLSFSKKHSPGKSNSKGMTMLYQHLSVLHNSDDQPAVLLMLMLSEERLLLNSAVAGVRRRVTA